MFTGHVEQTPVGTQHVTALEAGQETAVMKVCTRPHTDLVFYIPPYSAGMTFLFTLFLAICAPACENGGTCTFPGQCACPSDWTGARCDERTLTMSQLSHTFRTSKCVDDR